MIRLLIICLLLGFRCFAQMGVELPQPSLGLMDALQNTLEKQPGIQLQRQQLNLNRGILQAAAGQFDTLVSAGLMQNHLNNPLTTIQELQYAHQGLFTSSLASNTTTYTLNAQKLLRNGITIGPNLTLNRNTDNIATREGLNQAQLAFQVTLPVLRGRGRDAVDAQERSSESTVEASLRDVNQTIAQLLTTTAIQYWNVVAAERNLVIATDSENRGRNYVQDVQTLIDKDRVPRAEINQLIANLDGRTASRIAAEAQLVSAQQNLALAMGLPHDEITVLPKAADPLPDWSAKSDPELTSELIHNFVERALKDRADLIAANFRAQAARQLLPAARNQMLHQLNVSLSAGYNGLREGTDFGQSFTSTFNNVKGMNIIASVNWAFPVRNDAATGQFTQARAAAEQAQLTEADLMRNVASNVVTSMSTLAYDVTGLRKAREAVAYYRLALNDELDKFHLGLNSLVDVLTMEDRLTSALTTEVSAQLSYAVALENLRFATGTVIDANTPVHNLDKNTFLRPPFEWELQ